MIPKEWSVEKRTEVQVEKLMSDFNRLNDGEKCTCDNCTDKYTCSCAYDCYNTDGDCLLEK